MFAKSIIRAFILCFLGVLASPLLVATPASAGGFCHRPVTNEGGVRVDIHTACFVPTALRVSPGQVITWRNHDDAAHVVLGANGSWGSFDELGLGDTVSHRFTNAGVYPYACYLHPAMVGVVMVGDGDGAGDGSVTSIAQPIEEPPVRPAARRAGAPTNPPSGGDSWLSVAMLGTALVLTGAIAVLGVRRKLHPRAEPTT